MLGVSADSTVVVLAVAEAAVVVARVLVHQVVLGFSWRLSLDCCR